MRYVPWEDGSMADPFNVIAQLANHPLTEAGLKKFLADWEKVPKAK